LPYIKHCALYICTAFAIFIFAACTSQPQVQFENLDTLIAEGIIAPFDPENPQPQEFNVVQVYRGDIIQTLGFEVEIYFPNTYHLHFEVETISGNSSWITSTAWEHGHFSGINVRQGHIVNEGDFIAELTFDVPEPIIIARHALELERRQFETNFTTDQQNRLQELENLRLEKEIAPDGEWELIALRLEHAELAHRQFMINTANRREQFADRLEYINAPVEAERLYAPVSGYITWTTQHFAPGFLRDIVPVSMGAAGHFGRRIASIVDRDYMHFLASAPLYALRYGEIVQVVRAGGEAYFNAMVTTDPLTGNIVREGEHLFRLVPLEGEFERFMEEVEIELGDAFDPDTILGLLALRARPIIPLVIDGVLVERRAIIEEHQRSFVMLYEDGVVGRRYIVTGASGTVNVPGGTASVTEILSGISPGQWVVIP